MTGLRLGAVALLASLLATPAAAQTPARDRLATPGKPLTSVDDADATVVNPAGLASLPGWEARVQWSGGAERSDRGLAAGVATPLIFDFSGAIRADFMRPTRGEPRTWTTVALGYSPGERLSLGLSASRSHAHHPRFDAQWGLTAGFSWWPSAPLGFAGVVRNFNGHTSSAGYWLERSYEAGLVLRPTGKRSFEIGLDGVYGASERWSPRATLGIDIPGLGRLRGDALLARSPSGENELSLAAGVDLISGGSLLGGGLLAGQDSPGYYAALSLRGFRDGGIEADRHFVKLRIESTPSARSHVRLLRNLWRLAASPDVAGVAFHLKAEPAGSLAHAEELGDAIRMLRSRGKKVFCHLEDASGRALYVCSQADRIVINPAGGVRFAGMRSQYMYFADMLGKLGVRAEFVRIGAHKSAAEQFTRSGPTQVASDDHRELLREMEKTFLSDVGGGRKISVVELRDRLAKGPFVAREAREAGLVDGYAYDDELQAVASELEGRRVPLIDAASAPTFAPKQAEIAGARDRVAVIYVDGDMIDGRSRSVPLLGNKLVGSYTITAALKQAREDSRIRAVVLRLETPGGSSLAADVIWREVALTAKVKPVVASMGSMAASAGYYIASAASTIYASRSTITGSIGIFYGKADVEELSKKLGINVVTYRTGPRADAESFYRPFSDDERAELGRKVKQFYEVFIDRVSRGRKMTPDEVDAVARGKVWTGEQARDRKLVDHLGGLREAIAEAARLGHLDAFPPLVELPEQPRDLLSTALALTGLASEQPPETPLPPEALRVLRQLAPFSIHAADTPLARLDAVPEFL